MILSYRKFYIYVDKTCGKETLLGMPRSRHSSSASTLSPIIQTRVGNRRIVESSDHDMSDAKEGEWSHTPTSKEHMAGQSKTDEAFWKASRHRVVLLASTYWPAGVTRPLLVF